MTTTHAIRQTNNACGSCAYVPGEVINALVTVRQGREGGLMYELPCPITVQRPTDPSRRVFDQVKFLRPVDAVPYRAGQKVPLMLKIVSLHSVGRPNPKDESTTVNVALFEQPAIRTLGCNR